MGTAQKQEQLHSVRILQYLLHPRGWTNGLAACALRASASAHTSPLRFCCPIQYCKGRPTARFGNNNLSVPGPSERCGNKRCSPSPVGWQTAE